ncbi:MAG: nucleotidyl transferase AbiEii/AbiGii toxin family protein [Actinomycetota bacterium]|nr:nucleotidyl transferase AbiEii/AbiGii toxin family protein [Actinomycetota bacterium]
MANPNRDTTAGAAFLDLRALSKAQGRNVAELLDLYLLEGFLGRLATSSHSPNLVLKGGALLAAYGTRRPTRDVDLLATNLHAESDIVLAAIRDIAALPGDDGLVFDPRSATAHVIRDEDEYSGIRVSMTATLGRVRLAFHVDVNVGDPVWPPPGPVTVPGLLGGHVELLGYPLPTIYAEKVVTALQRGTANTRWRDFADVYLLRAQQDVDGTDLAAALTMVANHRVVPLSRLSQALLGYPELAQTRYRSWAQRRDLTDRLPQQFSDLLDGVCQLADPALTGRTIGRRWNHHNLAWL